MEAPTQDPKIRRRRIDPDSSFEATLVDEPPGEDVQEFESLLASENLKGGTISIRRKGATDSTYQHCQNIPSGDYSIDWLKNTYGGGDYVLDLRKADGTFFKKGVRVSIDYRHKGKMDSSLQLALPSNAGGDNMFPLLIQMMNQQAQAAQQASQQQQTMMLGMFQVMSGMMSETSKSTAAIIASIAKSNNPASEPMHRVIDAAANMMGKIGESKTQPLNETFQLIAQFKELFGDSDKKEDSGIGNLIGQLAPLLPMLMMGRQQPSLPQRQQPIQQPAQQPAQQSIQPTEIVLDESPEMRKKLLIMALRSQIPLLVSAAKKGADVVTYYNLLCDVVTEDQLNELCNILESENWIEVLFDNAPDVIANKPWFETLRKEILTPEDDDGSVKG